MTERQAVITDRPGRRTYSFSKPIGDRSPFAIGTVTGRLRNDRMSAELRAAPKCMNTHEMHV
jgi:hypothetical protein